MFEQTFKNIDDILFKDAGCDSELDYTEQISWMLFLKYLDDFDKDLALECELTGKQHNYLLDKDYRWAVWAAPKKESGDFDFDNALVGNDLIEFVKDKLFPYLRSFKERADSPDTIQYKIGEIFSELNCKIQSGYTLRDALYKIDSLRFKTQAEKHELSDLYETRVQNMGNAGRTGGQYYTPRPLIRAMIDIVKPRIGETIYDGAAGSAGFLCEAFDYLYYEDDRHLAPKNSLSTEDREILKKKTFYAKEKKTLPFIIAIMNMILHGIESPNVIHKNTLGEKLTDVQPSDQHDIVLANPPFGGKERPEIKKNFPIVSGETAYLFLQHFIKYLKPGGRAAIVIKDTFLFNSDNASVALRKELLQSCNLHTILDCPAKVFTAGLKTVVLFFTKGESTSQTWYYQLNPGRTLGKTSPLNDDDLKEFIEFQSSFKVSERSWIRKINELNDTFDLSVKNPKAKEKRNLREPSEIIDEIIQLDSKSEEILSQIKGRL